MFFRIFLGITAVLLAIIYVNMGSHESSILSPSKKEIKKAVTQTISRQKESLALKDECKSYAVVSVDKICESPDVHTDEIKEQEASITAYEKGENGVISGKSNFFNASGPNIQTAAQDPGEITSNDPEIPKTERPSGIVAIPFFFKPCGIFCK